VGWRTPVAPRKRRRRRQRRRHPARGVAHPVFPRGWRGGGSDDDVVGVAQDPGGLGNQLVKFNYRVRGGGSCLEPCERGWPKGGGVVDGMEGIVEGRGGWRRREDLSDSRERERDAWPNSLAYLTSNLVLSLLFRLPFSFPVSIRRLSSLFSFRPERNYQGEIAKLKLYLPIVSISPWRRHCFDSGIANRSIIQKLKICADSIWYKIILLYIKIINI